jgi:thiol:disulfide interchange protein DsbD
MGLILIIFGTLSNRMIKMPKAGAWTETVKKFIGLLMFGIAFYYIKPILPYNIFTLLLGAFIVVISGFFGVFNKLDEMSTNSMKFQKGISILILSTGIYLFINSIASKDLLGSNIISNQQESKNIELKKDELVWYKTEEEGFKVAKSEDKYIMIDFYADWCPACIELDKYTYTDKEVIKELENFTSIKIDSTKLTPEIKKLFTKYGIIGLPAVIFIDKQGKVLEDYTLSGFEKPSEFIKRIKAIKDINSDKVG